MKIAVVGFDPSLTHWGIASSVLDLTTGYLDTPVLEIVEPEKLTHKQVRQNSTDLFVAEQLAQRALLAARSAKVVFVEVPVGSQSARAMASYGVCVGILGAIRAEGIQLIEVTANEVKAAFTGCKTATKQQMIDMAVSLYPTANFPRQRGRLTAKAEHVADAIAAIHAGVNTPMFQNLIRLYDEG
jgi:Holliday junction resolvasome RuvABC endonuclease subunit